MVRVILVDEEAEDDNILEYRSLVRKSSFFTLDQCERNLLNKRLGHLAHNPMNTLTTQIEEEDLDSQTDADPVEDEKNSPTKNYIIRDDIEVLHDPEESRYPQEIEKYHRPRSLS